MSTALRQIWMSSTYHSPAVAAVVVNPLLFDFEGGASSDYPGYLDGHQGVAIDGDSTNYCLYAYDNANASANVEVLVRIYMPDHSTASDRMGVAVRASGSGVGSTTGYMLNIRPADITLYEVTTNTFAVLGTALTGSGDKLFPATWFWIRLRANSTSISAKVWRDGQTEPASFQITATDATHASGAAGWFVQREIAHCDYFAVDTNGGTAPSPDDTPGANQYQEDFSGETVGGAPSGWTNLWGPLDTTAAVIAANVSVVIPIQFQNGWRYEERDIRMQSSRSFMQIEWLSNTRGLIYYKDATFTNCEVLVKLRRSDAGQAITGNEFRIYLRANATNYGGAEDAYYVNFSSGDVHLSKYVLAAATNIDTSTGLTYSDGTFYWVRAEVTGTTFRVKVWTGAVGDEPGAWDATVTDSSVAGPGHVGFGCFYFLRKWEVHYFEIIDND